MVGFYHRNGWFSFPVVIVPQAEIARRIKPLSPSLDVWSLNPNDNYRLTDDAVIKKLLVQLELPNLFAQAAEHDEVRFCIAFDNHPTHWLQLDFFKGSKKSGGDGLAFTAYPKASITRPEMIRKLKDVMKEMDATGPITFSQIPMLETPNSNSQTTTATLRRS